MATAENLKPEEYQAVIGPSLHAVADVAAARGDPDLFNDLPSMLALMALVKDLGDLYQHHWGAMGQLSSPAVYEAAPLAACLIVLQEQEVQQESIEPMVQSLAKAYDMLRSENLLGREAIDVQKAWDAHLADNPDLAHTHMKQAARTVTNLIDTWEVKKETKSND